jgi:uncharacterized membrane protein
VHHLPLHRTPTLRISQSTTTTITATVSTIGIGAAVCWCLSDGEEAMHVTAVTAAQSLHAHTHVTPGKKEVKGC